MSEHKAMITWARHGVEVPASAAPAYLGNRHRVDPEAAFVAARSGCHMLTCLALASNKGFVVDSYGVITGTLWLPRGSGSPGRRL